MTSSQMLQEVVKPDAAGNHNLGCLRFLDTLTTFSLVLYSVVFNNGDSFSCDFNQLLSVITSASCFLLSCNQEGHCNLSKNLISNKLVRCERIKQCVSSLLSQSSLFVKSVRISNNKIVRREKLKQCISSLLLQSLKI